MPKLYILSAPSGAGKSSLAKALIERRRSLAVSVSHTTRVPRPGEHDGAHYHFVDRAAFERMVAAGEFLEHARVFDNYYGTARRSVETLLAAGKDVILDIDWQGARNIRKAMPDVVSIFILPPSRAALEERLRQRGQDDETVIARRMREAVAEMRHYDEFDHVIVNDEFDRALADIEAVMDGRTGAVRALTIDISGLLVE